MYLPTSQSVSQPTQPPARQDEGCEGAMSEKRWSPRAIDTALRQTGWQGTQDAGHGHGYGYGGATGRLSPSRII